MRVEEILLEGAFTKTMISCFGSPDTASDAFENLLEPLQKLLHYSRPVAASLALPEFFSYAGRKLVVQSSKKAFVRLNLLRVIKMVCQATEEEGKLIRRFGLYDTIFQIAENDSSIIAREIAVWLIETADESRTSATPGRVRPSSSGRHHALPNLTTPPTPQKSKGSYSQPPTPQHLRREISTASSVFDYPSPASSMFDSRTSRTSASFRPTSRDGNSGSSVNSIHSNASGSSSSSVKSPISTPQPSQSRLPKRLPIPRAKTEISTPLSTGALASMARSSSDISGANAIPVASTPSKFVVKKRRETSASMSTSKKLLKQKMEEEAASEKNRRPS
jgi:hypothetical protein